MNYVPDIYELTNIGVAVLLVFIVAIVLWASYDWNNHNELKGYNFYYSRGKKRK